MRLTTAIFLFLTLCSFGQSTVNFQDAYITHPSIPKGVLEAVSWSRTHMRHLDESTLESCTGMPQSFGIMGLFEDGKNYFKKNAELVAAISGRSIASQKASPQVQLMAYASAFSIYYSEFISSNPEASAVYLTLDKLSEIPDSGSVNLFAKDAQIFEVMRFMNDVNFSQTHNFIPYHYSLSAVFGASNYSILASSKVFIGTSVSSQSGTNYGLSAAKSTQYGPAIWNPAATCNISSRGGTAISAITIHTIQGSYAGAISWAQNCASSVSYHYVVRSSDGQITQMVLEEDKAWHVGSENPYTIGYEHEGYIDDASWYTQAMYQASADLSRDITQSGYGIPPLRTYYGTSSATTQTLGGCTKIKGHQHFPNQSHTDPGINWDWEKYYRLINNTPTITTLSNPSDPFYDSGGNTSNYQDDERKLWIIAPMNATSITLNFTLFNVELNYDYLFIHDGPTLNDPIIGMYTGTNSPGIITSSSGSLLLEFRSDCATTGIGWEANYTSTTNSNEAPVTSVLTSGNWKTSNFDAFISDTDADSGIDGKFYLIADRETSNDSWQSNATAGFAFENFETNATNWINQTGTFALNTNTFEQTDVAESNSNSYMNINQIFGVDYLYSWKQTFTSSGSNQRAGMHFMCSDPTFANRGNSYFIYLRETDNTVQIYSVDNDIFTLQASAILPIDVATEYQIKTIYSPQSGWIKVYINDIFCVNWQDATPLTSGNSVSLRTGNCGVKYDDVKVYQSHNSLVSVNVGTIGTMRYESIGALETGMIEAIAVDATNLWSSPSVAEYLIDRSAPTLISIADGLSVDIDTFNFPIVDANWNFEDIHSGIAMYEYSIGTNTGATDIINWTNATLATSLNEVLASPIYNQYYYVNVRTTNGAELYSVNSSDGQILLIDNTGIESNYFNDLIIYPNPTTDIVYFENVNESFTISIIDENGKEVLTKQITQLDNSCSLFHFAQGKYSLVLKASNGFQVRQLIKK